MARIHPIAACLIVIACARPLAAQTQSDRLAGVLDEADFSGAVIVTKDGVAVLVDGRGMANRELGVRNTPETKFRIGSVTKQFTAMGVLILQDRGVLDVRDPVGQHVEGLPATWQDLTIHQLLTHTSGIMHSWALPGFSETMAVPTTLDATLQRYFDRPLLFEPGSGYQYSGVGYFLLAKLIEEVSGQTYGTFLETEIFDPLGMRDTGADHPTPVLGDRASGYERGEDSVVRNAPAIFMPLLTGGGDLYSTVHDLAKWDRALANHMLVSDDAYSAMYRPEREGYAYGWQVREVEGREALLHSGGVPGFNAFNLRIPSEGIAVIVLSNVTPGRAEQVARALAEVMLGSSQAPGGSF